MGKKFHLQNRLAWISIEGLPPHAWHEAAFTHIAGTWGEVIFPETCNKNSNNLVAGKVCIRTKCMEVIQHNMPVDDVHFCVRIKEIMGECDEVLSDEKSTDTELDEDCTSSNDDSFGKEDVHSEEDDDDFYDDGSHCNLFMDEVNEIQGGGGWIQNDVGDSKVISSPQSSKSDNIQNEKFTGLILKNSNIKVEGEIQISPQSGSCNMDTFMHFVPDTHIEERSPCTQGILDKHVPDSLENRDFIPRVDLSTQSPLSLMPVTFKTTTSNKIPRHNKTQKPNSHHSPTHSPLQNQNPLHFSAKHGTSKKNNKIVSLKLIHPFIGINIRSGKKKNNTSDAVTKPTSSLDTSISDNESNIQRCNNWQS
ncbi:hypothetical protein Tco_0746638 [Tanacetum coccineum]